MKSSDVAASPATATRIPGEEGIWVFVLGDMTVFALFFCTFMYSRGKNPGAFARDHGYLLVSLGTLNTVLLLTSSVLVALGMSRVLDGRHTFATRLFTGALGCGMGFVAVKVIEWTRLFVERKGVGSGEFFSYYFMFTGIHLGHVVIGLVILTRLVVVSRQTELTYKQLRFCESGGIFWHMVDLLWVVLFALFYLLR